MSTPPPDDPYWQSLPDHWYGRKLKTYTSTQTPTQKCQIGFMVNKHDILGWKQGLVQFNLPGNTGADQIYVGRIEIWRNGSRTQYTTINQWIDIADTQELDKSSPWDQNCTDSFYWTARAAGFNILWKDGTQMVATTVDSYGIDLAC